MVFKKKSLAKKFFKGFRRMHTSDRMMCITKGSPMSKPWSSSYYHSASDHSATYEQNFAVPFSACLLCCVHFFACTLAAGSIVSPGPGLCGVALACLAPSQTSEGGTSCSRYSTSQRVFYFLPTNVKHLVPILTPDHRYNPPDDFLPESYTCFFLLKVTNSYHLCHDHMCDQPMSDQLGFKRPHKHREAPRTLGGPTNIGRPNKHWEAPQTLGGPTNIGRL